MEEWKVITGHENYEVSTHGRVRNKKTGRILKQQENHNGYLKVALNNKHLRVHRLVAIAFIPNDNPQEKTQVNHIDENKKNNHVDNLEWVTQADNLQHGTRTERTKKRVRCIELNTIYDSIKQASEETGCKESNIVNVCKGKKKRTGGYHWEYVD